jgi:hypothetical protein
MEWKSWSNVSFNERHLLPSSSGIYVVVDSNDCVWYVGQAANLKNRWAGKSHHRYRQLSRSNSKLHHRIYWLPIPMNYLNEREKQYVVSFQPELNGSKVKKLIPRQRLKEQEVKRLLKVLNKPTSLFPIIRSIVAGEYEDVDGVRCIIILININDSKIIENSMGKRYATEERQPWTYDTSYCGKDEQLYKSIWMPAYSCNGCKFEFVVMDWEFFEYFIKNPNANLHYIGVSEVFGIEVKVLTDLTIFDKLSLPEEHGYINYNGKKSLRLAAYINYRKTILKCLALV